MKSRLKDRFAYLEIRSYIGVSFGAQHYYGEMRCGHKRVDLKHRMSAAQAARLNKAHDWKGYKAGSLSEHFESKEQLIAVAVESYKEHFPEAILLVQGSPVYAEPQPCLAGEPALMEKINRLAAELKAEEAKNGDRQQESRRMRDICDEYWSIACAEVAEVIESEAKKEGKDVQ